MGWKILSCGLGGGAHSGLAREEGSLHGGPMNELIESAISEAPHPLQVKAWQALGGNGRSELAAELRRKARGWKRDALRTQNPSWSPAQIEQELGRIYLRGNT